MEMIDVNGALYGTTVSGGRGCNGYGCGTVFEVSTSGGGSILYSFEGGKDGEQPLGGLTDVDGTLYGTTQVGGAHHDWTVFELNPSTGAEQVLYNFEGGKDGADPEAGLISVNGVLYGTTKLGGGSTNCSGGCGTVFDVTP